MATQQIIKLDLINLKVYYLKKKNEQRNKRWSFVKKQSAKISSHQKTEEQIMMRDSVKEFVDKELWPHKDVLKKDA
jgi:hypothetical protein